MKLLLIAALLAPSIALAAGNNARSFTSPPRWFEERPVHSRDVNVNPIQQTTVQTGAQATAGGGSAAINVTDKGSARAPDISSYPTAPCVVTGGISGGWLTGAFGITGGAVNEGCEIREFSRLLHEQGNKAAATQLLCLNANARKALEATGTRCLIAADSPPPVVKP